MSVQLDMLSYDATSLYARGAVVLCIRMYVIVLLNGILHSVFVYCKGLIRHNILFYGYANIFIIKES